MTDRQTLIRQFAVALVSGLANQDVQWSYIDAINTAELLADEVLRRESGVVEFEEARFWASDLEGCRFKISSINEHPLLVDGGKYRLIAVPINPERKS